MSKKILILNGSPRPGGNTELLAEAVAKGVEEAGNQPIVLHLRQHKLQPCLGCYHCLTKQGDPCAQKDDMHKVYDALEVADVVVYASPLYWWQFTAQMKAVIDRMFAFMMCKTANRAPKDCALVVAAEDNKPENFAFIVPYYQTCLTKNIGWQDKGMLLAGGVNMIGDVNNTDYLQQAKELGAKL